MAVPPGLTRCDDAEIDRYYTSLLEATPLPVIIQDASSYVGHALSVDVQASLFRRHPGRVMFKPEGAPLVPKMEALRKAAGAEAPMFEGAGGLALIDSFWLGVAGTMPGSDLVWAVAGIWRTWRSGKHLEIVAKAAVSFASSKDGMIMPPFAI